MAAHLAAKAPARQPNVMIVTHTQDPDGNCRIYLGGKSSMECWLEPSQGDTPWQFKFSEAVSGSQLDIQEQRTIAQHLLLQLANALNVHPEELHTVSFEAIAALHSSNPFDGRRIATPKKHAIDHGFVATVPHIARPQKEPRRDEAHGRPRDGYRF